MRASILAFAASAAAFPSMGSSPEELEQMLKRNPAPAPKPEPQILPAVGATVGSLVGSISGLLGSVASSVDPQNKRPEKNFRFKSPTGDDSRGPCPALNLLANYGYLPRDGHVTFGQVVNATARGFNMGTDLSTLLSVFAVLTDGDIATESWYLGAGPNNVGGLNRHSTVEADISPNREDYYNGCGDNHHLSSRLFKQNVALAAASPSKQFDLGVMGDQYLLNSKFSQQYNPFLYYFPFPMIVSLGAFVFYPNFFSNGTFGAGGVANYESISSIIGASYFNRTGEYQYVPEAWPENWYRRATPYGAVQALTEALANVYVKNPVTPGASQVGTPNLTPQTILCDVYQGINSIVPSLVNGDAAAVAAATSWALSKLDPVFGGTALGCPPSTLSPSNPPLLFRNASSKGGPLNVPAAVAAKTGNNQYRKTYFAKVPKTPAC